MSDPGYVLNLRTEEAQKAVDDAIFAAENEKLDQAAALARSMSPRRTGHNAESIIARCRRTQSGAKGTLATQSGYGGWIEIGTKNMPARPYLYPAAVQALGEIAESARVKIAKSSR